MVETNMPIPIMEISTDAVAIFRSRQNRFVGIVDITSPKRMKSKGIKVHIQDPGRLKELLYPGNKVLLKREDSATRKTDWDVIAASIGDMWILIHTGYHRKISEWVINSKTVNPFGKIKSIKPEATYGNSRLDFLLVNNQRKKLWVEVKGCTLAIDGIALFPDAPTERGRKHLRALITAKKKGAHAAVMILAFRPDAKCFAPNKRTDPKFSITFQSAIKAGVNVYILCFKYDNGIVYYVKKIPICIEYLKK
jgi:sugar fermentation stimulation protein A